MLVGHEIIPGLYQRGMFKKYSLPRKIALLEGAGVRTVICMITDWDEELATWMNGHGMTYIHHPIPDGRIVDSSPIYHIGVHVAMKINMGERVIVHCRAGRNRSALVSAIAVMLVLRVTGKEAIEIVRRSRPNSLANEHFVAYLEGLYVPELHHR